MPVDWLLNISSRLHWELQFPPFNNLASFRQQLTDDNNKLILQLFLWDNRGEPAPDQSAILDFHVAHRMHYSPSC